MAGLVMKRYAFVMCLAFLFIASLETGRAEISLPQPFKINTCGQLIQVCSNCSYVNLTRIQYPDNTIQDVNIVMAKNGANYNSTFCSTTQLGSYFATTCGDPDGIFTCESYTFKVTTTGNDSVNTLPIFLLIVGFCLLVFSAYNRMAVLGFASGIILTVTGVYFIIYGLGIMVNVYTQAIGYVSLFIGLIAAFAATYEMMADNENTMQEV